MRDDLGAFIDPDMAVDGAADGLLARKTFAAKDIFDVKGEKTGFGNPDWRRNHPPATAHAVAVQRLLDAGADLRGKTHTEETAFSINGENFHYGTPINVGAPRRIPGGSSSGSAAAVAAGLVDFALGSDTGGSVRIPASYCGLYGLRPTHGRVDMSGVIPLAPSFDVVGWFTREPQLLRDVGKVLLDNWKTPPEPTRLIVPTNAWELADPAVVAALLPHLDALKERLGGGEEIALAEDGLDAWLNALRAPQLFEAWASHGQWVSSEKPKMAPQMAARWRSCSEVTRADIDAFAPIRRAIHQRLSGLLPPGTIMALPSTPCIAPLRGHSSQRDDPENYARILKLTCIAGLGGLPQVSLPLGTVEGCPVGFSVVAGRGGDEMLLELAAGPS